MKKIVSIVLAFAILLCFTACGSGTGAREAVNGGLTALKNFDVDGIERYFVDGKISEEELDTAGSEQAKAIFASFSWKIESCIEDGDTAAAAVEITYVSLAGVVSELVAELMEEMMAGNLTNETTEEYVLKRMDEMIKDPSAPTATMTITLNLQKVDDQWQISNPQSIVAMLTLGLEGIISGEK